MAYDTTVITYNWFSDIIREKIEPRAMKKEFIDNSADLPYVAVIKDVRNDLAEILEKYHAGNIGAAYEKMKNMISLLMDETNGIAVSTVQNSFAFNDIEDVLNNSTKDDQIEFFRARTSEVSA